MAGKHQKTKDMDEGSRKRTNDTGSNPTKSRGMGTGTTTMTRVFIDTIWERTCSHWVGEDTWWLAFTILVGTTGTGMEPNLVKKIKPMLDSGTNSKTMGHIMGYVGAQEQWTPLRRTGTTTNSAFSSQHSDSGSLCGQSSATTTRCTAPAAQTNWVNTRVSSGIETALARIDPSSPKASTATQIRQIP